MAFLNETGHFRVRALISSCFGLFMSEETSSTFVSSNAQGRFHWGVCEEMKERVTIHPGQQSPLRIQRFLSLQLRPLQSPWLVTANSSWIFSPPSSGSLFLRRPTWSSPDFSSYCCHPSPWSLGIGVPSKTSSMARGEGWQAGECK